ncbi:solute carrier family 25 member 44-like [Scleropages formosus]|uniref:Solute carrier family 25 member 44-like n=1 Tax=Scleropages formosus TaxID=113540 RepID=A0A0P7YLT2_SCLFO|nr:solute carrier family 25 member 44-like [Scleropages formosus]
MQQKRNIQIIEWEDLDKRKFYSFGVFMTMTIRATVYPATLIRTRLQVQKGKSLYNGTFDAFFKILRAEGVRGLYRGFMVNTFTLISGQAYITTYELVRKYVSSYSTDNTLKSLVAGGSASLVAQSITVPIDVVSQQLMMQGQGAHLTRFKVKPKMAVAAGKHRVTFGQTRDIIAQIFAADGFRGFYRGYVASLLTYIPNSAVWWPFYHFYAGSFVSILIDSRQSDGCVTGVTLVFPASFRFVSNLSIGGCAPTEQLSKLAPSECPHLLLQAVAGPLAAATASTVTNPMDVVRARVQVEGRSSVIQTFKQLLAEEGFLGMTKGLSARIISSTPTAIVIVVGYETLKKLSLRPELVDSRHW